MTLIPIIGVGVVVLCILAQFVMYIIVLVKLFKEKGALHGILGFFVGIYPFIWGWIMHKQLKLTKIMLIWTILFILLPILGIMVAIGVPLMAPDAKITKFKTSPPRVSQRPVRKRAPVVAKRRVSKPAPKKGIPKPTVAEISAQKGIDYDREFKRINELIKKDGKNADAFYNRGWLFASKGALNEALRDYNRAIEIDKTQADIYYNRGLLHVKMKRYDLAVKDLDAAIMLNPNDPDAYSNRGNINYQLGKNNLAIQDYTRAIKMRPDDPDLYQNRGIVYLSVGEKDEAAADSVKAGLLRKARAKKSAGGSKN